MTTPSIDSGVAEQQLEELYSAAYTSILGQKKTLIDIIEHASKKNADLRISGMLWFADDTNRVIEILEGPRATLEELLESLRVDPRHTAMHVSYFRPVDSRRFQRFGVLYGVEEFSAHIPDLAEALSLQGCVIRGDTRDDTPAGFRHADAGHRPCRQRVHLARGVSKDARRARACDHVGQLGNSRV